MDSETTLCCMLCKVKLQSAYDMLKACMLIYNFVFMVLAWVILALGIYAEYMRATYTEQEHFLMTPSVFLILVGCFIIFFAFCGFVGGLRDNLFLLKVFGYCVMICFVLELAGGLIAFFARPYAKTFVNEYILKGMSTYYDDVDLKNFVDYVQREFECCGGLVYNDWTINPYHACDAPGPSACGVPYSCCRPTDNPLINSMCGYETISMSVQESVKIIHVRGCIDGVLDYLWSNLDIFGGILLGILLPQILGIWLALSYEFVLLKVVDVHDRNTRRLKDEEEFLTMSS